MTLGKRIASLREKRGLSQKQLGEKMGRTGRTAELRIQHLEHDRARASLKEIVRLAEIFELTVDAFLKGVDLD